MTIGEYTSIGSLFLALAGTMIGAFIKLKTDIAAINVRICNSERNFTDHKNENNITFGQIAATLDKVAELHANVLQNSERIIAITAQFDEHKIQNDKSFEMISELVKQNRQDNKDEHNELKQLIREKK